MLRQVNLAKLLIDDGVYAFHSLKLCSYRIEVHQMFIQCSQSIADEPI